MKSAELEINMELDIEDVVLEFEDVTFDTLLLDFDMQELIDGGRLPDYLGEYVVIPKVRQDQELATANKSLIKNVIVKEIPYTETHNDTGITFTIGGE